MRNSVRYFPTGLKHSEHSLVVLQCCLFIALPVLYSRAVEERSGFFISLSPAPHTRLTFSRCSVGIYQMHGWVNAFWHQTSTSGLKDRLDGAEIGGSESGLEHHTIARERNVESLNYICGGRNSREEIDSGDLRK